VRGRLLMNRTPTNFSDYTRRGDGAFQTLIARRGTECQDLSFL
jgi:hypothetical protein